MPYVVDVCVALRARQGLPLPVRAAAGQQRLVPRDAVEVVLRAGVSFADGDLTERGRFPFRPTFELVARHLYWELAPEVPGWPSWNSRTGRTVAARATGPAPDSGAARAAADQRNDRRRDAIFD